MKETSKEKVNTFKNHIFMLKFIAKHTPFMAFGYLFSDILSNLPWTLSNVVLLKYIIDVASEGKDFQRILYALIFFAAFVIITNLFGRCNQFFALFALEWEKIMVYNRVILCYNNIAMSRSADLCSTGWFFIHQKVNRSRRFLRDGDTGPDAQTAVALSCCTFERSYNQIG